MIKRGARPIRGVVTDGTISRESSLHVVGIRRAVVERNVTGTAACRRSREDIVHVTLGTLNTAVGAR